MSELFDGHSYFDDVDLDIPDEAFEIGDDQVERSDADSRDDVENIRLTSRPPSRACNSVRADLSTPEFSPISSDGEDEAQVQAVIDGTEDPPLSPFEALPAELMQEIASRADSDLEVRRLALTSPNIAGQLNPDESDIWRRRFLALYDYPLIESPYEFAVAYKLRRFVLRKFQSSREIPTEKAKVQLEVLKDMVLETYNRPKPHLPLLRHSKNLAAFGSPATSPWMVTFTGNPLYRNEFAKYGRPHTLFDTLQVLLSHLVLSPNSAVAQYVTTRRDNYDLARVYRYNRPLEVLLKRVVAEPEEPPTPSFRSSRFPHLRLPSPLPPKPQYELDMHTLLHIRNFWQRHLVDDKQSISEHTYSSMGKALLAIGKVPQKWDSPLQEHIPLNIKWYGHYSCLHPWPKSRDDLEECQTCAEDWDSIDPMTLVFETSKTNQTDSFWPPLFSTIAIFGEAMPHQKYFKETNVTYIRGIAPFRELREGGKQSPSSSSIEDDVTPKIPIWHPFTASRLHGVVHDIPAAATFGSKSAQEQAAENEEVPIPGWKHIMMIIYKPCTRALLSILEHAEEDYGGTADTDFNTANIWNPNNNGTTTITEASANNVVTAQGQAVAAQNADSTEDESQDQVQPGEEQIEAQLKALLARRIASFTMTYSELLAIQSKHQDQPELVNSYIPSYAIKSKPKKADLLPLLWSPQHIRQLEDSFSPAQYMKWDDGTIEYAYAYEGVIIPGGKIMMGRFWRIHGIEGMGPGKEVGPDGVGVEVRPVHYSSSSTVGDGEDATADAAHEDGGGGKRKGKAKARRRSKRKQTQRKNRRKGRGSDDEDGDDTGDNSEFQKQQDKRDNEKEPEYEFVTMLNGEESRAQNACKGLERGPFVFWAG